MPRLSQEYSECQYELTDLELRRRRLTQELSDVNVSISSLKRRLKEIEDEAAGRVQQSLFDDN